MFDHKIPGYHPKAIVKTIGGVRETFVIHVPNNGAVHVAKLKQFAVAIDCGTGTVTVPEMAFSALLAMQQVCHRRQLSAKDIITVEEFHPTIGATVAISKEQA